jgi:hypothetical protein
MRDRIKFLFILIGIVAVIVDLSSTLFPVVFLYVLSGIAQEAYRLTRAGRQRKRRFHPHPPDS